MNENDTTKLNNIFFPIGTQRIENFKKQQHRLAYYTTEETAKKILQNSELWMRNASVMNDYSEIQYGINMLINAFNKIEIDSIFAPPIASIFQKILLDFFASDRNESSSWIFNTYFEVV